MASQEELDFLKNHLGKIRYRTDETGKKILFTNSPESIESVIENFDVLRDNFEYFVTCPNSIMYPNEFIFVIQAFPEGKQLIFDNIDFILKKNNYKRNAMAGALAEIDGIEEILLEDFQNRLRLFISGKTESVRPGEIFPKFSMCDKDETERLFGFLTLTSKGKDATKVFEENKNVFLNPTYNDIMPRLVSMLAKKAEFHEFLRNNFDRIIQCSREEHIIDIYKVLKDVVPERYSEESFAIEQIFDKAVAKIEEEKHTYQGDDYEICMSQVKRTCGRIVAQKQSKDIESMIKVADREGKPEVCGLGGCAIALKAGGKVFKVGGDRLQESNFEIPNHPRLLRPIIRKRDISTLENHPLYFEVQDEVDTDIEVTDEELLEIYKELRAAGIKWCDAKKKNLGRLRADNCGYPIGYGPPANNQSLGLIGEDSFGSSLKKGDLVIIDLDLLYPLDCKQAQFIPAVPDFIREYEAEISKAEKEEKQKEVR